MNKLIIFLLKNNAHLTPVNITTLELGKMLGFSQQTISRKLANLEKKGFIKREGGIFLTKKAIDKIYSVYGLLQSIFDRGFEIKGTIVSGLGEGKYYLSLEGYKVQIKEKLGFEPYPGTLNIKILASETWKRQQLNNKDKIIIDGFTNGQRTFGSLLAYRCTIEGEKCAIVIPIRTHHGSEVIEVISQFNLREKLNKKTGDEVKVLL